MLLFFFFPSFFWQAITERMAELEKLEWETAEMVLSCTERLILNLFISASGVRAHHICIRKWNKLEIEIVWCVHFIIKFTHLEFVASEDRGFLVKGLSFLRSGISCVLYPLMHITEVLVCTVRFMTWYSSVKYATLGSCFSSSVNRFCRVYGTNECNAHRNKRKRHL